MKWIAVVVVTLLLLLGTLAGVRSMRTGGSFWISIKTTRVATHEGIGEKIKALVIGVTTPALAEAALGTPDERWTDRGLERWTYVETVTEEDERRLLGFFRVGGGMQRSTNHHQVEFVDGKLADWSQAGGTQVEPSWPVRWKTGKMSMRGNHRMMIEFSTDPGHKSKLDAVRTIANGVTRASELDSRFGAPAKLYKRDDLEVREYQIHAPRATRAPGVATAVAGNWSCDFRVVLQGDLVVDAPLGESAPDELLKRLEGYEAWDRK